MKNVHGAQVGDIWLLRDGDYFLLLEYRENSGGPDEDAFYALCLNIGHHDFVFFDHHVKSKNWERIA